MVARALAAMAAQAQTLTGGALVKALERGGYMIVMRHANSPRVAPDAPTANPDNVNRERQLDAKRPGDGGRGMQVSTEAQAEWLRPRVSAVERRARTERPELAR